MNNIPSSTEERELKAPPFRLKAASFAITVVVVSCLSILFLWQLSFLSMTAGLIGIGLVYSVSTVAFMERLRYRSYCLINEANSRGELVEPQTFDLPKRRERRKGMITAVFGVCAMYFVLHQISMNSTVTSLLVGMIGLSIYFIVQAGYTYRWLIFVRFGIED